MNANQLELLPPEAGVEVATAIRGMFATNRRVLRVLNLFASLATLITSAPTRH